MPQREIYLIEAADLKSKLERFYQHRFDQVTKKDLLRRAIADLSWKTVALLLAVILWLVFAFRIEPVERTFIVPIEYRGVPENLVVSEPRRTRA